MISPFCCHQGLYSCFLSTQHLQVRQKQSTSCPGKCWQHALGKCWPKRLEIIAPSVLNHRIQSSPFLNKLCGIKIYFGHVPTIKPLMRDRIKSPIQLPHCDGLWIYNGEHHLQNKTFLMQSLVHHPLSYSKSSTFKSLTLFSSISALSCITLKASAKIWKAEVFPPRGSPTIIRP